MHEEAWRMKAGARQARSVLECTGPPPLCQAHRSQRRERTLDPAADGLSLCFLPGFLSVSSPAQSARGQTPSKAWRCVVPLFCFIILHSALCLRAQGPYSIHWSTMDGGGGTGTGGVYTVSGTIGQPDAGTMSGGTYTLQGGFWGVIAAVQTPGAPTLSVWRTPTNTVVVSWPSPSTGFALFQNTNLNTANWVSPPETVNDNGTEKFILLNPPTGSRFYRLQKPEKTGAPRSADL